MDDGRRAAAGALVGPTAVARGGRPPGRRRDRAGCRDLLVALPGGAMLRDGSTMHLRATDEGLGADGEWTIRGGPARISWERGHGLGDVALSGAAADLLLAVMRRIPGDDGRLVVTGERENWTTWLANTAY
jgi:hypothetical protein